MRSRKILAASGILAALFAGVVIGQAVDPGTELALIERVVKARADLKASLIDLVNYYRRTGDITKAGRAERELDQFTTIETYDYAKSTAGPVVDGPISVLKYIEEADVYYTDGVIIAENRRKSRKDLALRRFEKVLETWPESDKGPLAAYRMAEIYAGVYYGQHELAYRYYKKAYDLDPSQSNIGCQPALVKAGGMLVKLGRYDDAKEVYRLAQTGSRDSKHKAQAEKALDRLTALGY